MGSQVDSLPAEMVPPWHTCLRSALGAPAGLTRAVSSIFQGDGASEAAHATNCASCPFPGVLASAKRPLTADRLSPDSLWVQWPQDGWDAATGEAGAGFGRRS